MKDKITTMVGLESAKSVVISISETVNIQSKYSVVKCLLPYQGTNAIILKIYPTVYYGNLTPKLGFYNNLS